jgi:uncharacterized tellurite resistance protein B-like protein
MTASSAAGDATVKPSRFSQAAEKIQADLAQKLLDTFDLVIAKRSRYYAEHSDKVPTPAAVPGIINAYATKNMAVSGGTSLIPGPWGMVAAVPEIVVVVYNQLALIYDVGMAYGQSKVLKRELLAGVFLTALGAGAGGLLVMHGGRVLVRRVALRTFQRIVQLLAGKVTQQVIKSAVSKWVPFLGAAAMGAWANYTTRQVGKKADEILQKPIEMGTEPVDDSTEEPELPVEAKASTVPVDVNTLPHVALMRLQALITLVGIDRKVLPEERAFIEPLIEQAEIEPAQKIDMANLMDCSTKPAVDFASIARDPAEAIGLLMDMVALAKRDGEFHLAEKIYIKQAAQLMGIAADDVAALVAGS